MILRPRSGRPVPPARPARLVLLAALVAGLVLAVASPAAAHVDLDPAEAFVGSTQVLSFSFHHGKDGAATTGLSVQLPPGAEVVDVPDKEGWTSTVEGDPEVVTWSGGEVPDGVEESFQVEVRLPDEPGVVLFPTVQDGPAGELAWIAAEGGASEADNPAPRLALVVDPDAPTTTEATTTTTTEAPAPTDPPASDEDADLDGEAAPGGSDGNDDGGGSALPWLLGAGLVAALVAGGVALARRRADPSAP